MVNNIKKSASLLMAVTLLSLQFGNMAFAQDHDIQAPDFELPGKQVNVKLSNSKGKLVYLDFWASWCGPCKQSIPWMNALQEKYRSRGFEVIAINLDSNHEDAQKFLAATPAKFTVAFDSQGQTPRQYGVKGMPTSYLISREGIIMHRHMGFNSSDRDHLEQIIRTALDEKT